MRPYGSLCVFIGPYAFLWDLISLCASLCVLIGSSGSLYCRSIGLGWD